MKEAWKGAEELLSKAARAEVWKEGPGIGGLATLDSGSETGEGLRNTFSLATLVLVRTQSPFVHR